MPDNINVEPSGKHHAVKVATDVIGDVHYPVYIDFMTQISKGTIAGVQPFFAYGQRTAAAAETNRVVWPNGPFEIPPVAGVQMSVVSTSANDDLTGTHAQILELHYLDGSLNEQTEFIEMDGLTPVLTTATDIRFINCMHVHQVGGAATNFAEGDILASNGGTTYAQIAAGEVRCTSSARMVPAGKCAYISGAIGGAASGTASTSVVLRLVASELDIYQYVDPLVLYPYGGIGIQDNSATYNFPSPLRFTEGTVIAITATTDKAAEITASWFGWLEDAA
jgi:hypothetical protein